MLEILNYPWVVVPSAVYVLISVITGFIYGIGDALEFCTSRNKKSEELDYSLAQVVRKVKKTDNVYIGHILLAIIALPALLAYAVGALIILSLRVVWGIVLLIGYIPIFRFRF